MNIDSIYSPDELAMAISIRNEIPVNFYSVDEMIDWEVYCSNADNGLGGDITTGKRLPTLAEWVNRK
jgi:hypothetical protein